MRSYAYCKEYLPALAEILRKAGEIIRNAHRNAEAIGIREKAAEATHVNFVTAYDTQVQFFLKEQLLRLLPDATFYAEEAGEQNGNTAAGDCFVIDPIDGTANFIRDYRTSAISVALLHDGIPVLGTIYDPYGEILYTAVRGEGACRNGVPMHVSQTPADASLILIGTAPYYKEELGERTLSAIRALLLHCADLRRSGSAALDPAAVACGCMDGFFEARLSPWDYAAGALLITEAGGTVTDASGQPLRFDRPCSVLAGNACNYPTLAKLIQNSDSTEEKTS